MCSVHEDRALYDWLCWAEESGPSFLRTIAEASFMGDLKNYNLMWPALFKLKEANPRTGLSMRLLSDDAAKSSVVLDRDPTKRKVSTPPALAFDARSVLVAPQGRLLVLHLRASMEHVRYRSSVPRMPPSVDFDAVPLV